MTISERALNFSIRVHEQYTRDDLSVVHSLLMGILLKSYEFNDKVVAAGYLHDIPKISEFTFDDIAHLFGGRVASLVMTASEVDKSLEWRDYKKQTLKYLSNLPEENIAVICADKIVNLEDLKIKFKKQGKPDFSEFKVSKEELESFYKEIYAKISSTLDSPMIDRLRDAIYDVFNRDIFSSYDSTFDEEQIEFSTLSREQEELFKLRTIVGDNRPYIIEFLGTSRSGKSTIMRMFKDFFDTADFRVKVCEEQEIRDRYENGFLSDTSSISTVEKNLLISSAIEGSLMKEIIGDQNVIMVESSLYSILLLLKMLFKRKIISEETFKDYVKNYLPDIEFLVNYAVITCKAPDNVMIRKYSSEKNILPFSLQTYAKDNEAARNVQSLLQGTDIVDVTKIDPKEATLRVADTLFPIMTDEYVLKLKQLINENREAS